MPQITQFNIALSDTVELCYIFSLVGLAGLQARDHRIILRSSLSSLVPRAIELCSGRHCRALIQVPFVFEPCSNQTIIEHSPITPVEPCSRGRGAPLRRALSSLAPVPLVVKPFSNQAIVEHCFDHPCRALLRGPWSPAPAGTVEPCCGRHCRA